MMEAAVIALVAAGLVLSTLAWTCQRRLLRALPPPEPPAWPPVSVLKPLCGADPDLERNLVTFFAQDYPEYEIVFAAEDPHDPSLDVARAVAARFPHVRTEIVAGAPPAGLNPKVNNLAAMLPRARHATILISDSNVAAPAGYLRALAAHLTPGVALVSSLFRGTGERGLGGALEALQLNTFVMAGVSAAHGLLRVPCVVGKSMLLRRADLESIGGFAFLARYLAEDQVCGEELHRRGRGLAVSGFTIDNVLGARTLRAFLERHLRWCRIRARVNPAAYAGEMLLNPVFLALAGAAAGAAPLWLPAAALAVASTLASATERGLGVRRALWRYPGLELLRAILTGLTWIVPFFSSRIAWRGHAARVGPRTLLEPASPQRERPAPQPAEA